MSQVKNLRAMFENKGEDTSPPDRGRSPGVSSSMSNAAGTNGSESPRPLSKIRTNFVAIEKDGRMGLRRDRSGESSLSRRRLSTDTDAESISTLADRPAMAPADELAKPMSKLFISEPIPESPRQPPNTSAPSQDAGGVTDKPSAVQNERPREGQTTAALTQPDLTAKSTSEDVGTKEATPFPSKGGPKEDDKPARSSAAQPRTTVTAPKKSPTKSTSVAKQTANSTAKGSAGNKSLTETPKKPNAQSTAKVQEKPVPKRETTAAVTKPATAAAKSKPMSSTTANKAKPLNTASHSDTGFVKPKPKSPTKPVHLPSSLTAPTASSVSKGLAPRQSLSRQSGSLQDPSSPAHSSTRASLSATSSAARKVNRQGSAIGRPRPSVGPPPSKASQPEHHAAKRQSHVDDGFLARMMRPTQSSSSKTADKGHVTPPKKTAPRPSSSATLHGPRLAGSAKKVAEKTAAAPRPRAPSSHESEAAASPGKSPHEADNAKTTASVAGSVQGSGEAHTAVEALQPEAPSEPETVNVITPEATQSEAAPESAAAPRQADLIETPAEQEALGPAHQPAALEDLRTETPHVEAKDDATLARETEYLIQAPPEQDTTAHLDTALTDEPAPEATQTDEAEEEIPASDELASKEEAALEALEEEPVLEAPEKEPILEAPEEEPVLEAPEDEPALKHEEQAFDLEEPALEASREEPALQAATEADPPKNSESNVSDTAHEVATEPLAESADIASEDKPVTSIEEPKQGPILEHTVMVSDNVSIEEEKREPLIEHAVAAEDKVEEMSTHMAVADTEAVHVAEGLDHSPQSGSEQQVQASGGELAAHDH